MQHLNYEPQFKIYQPVHINKSTLEFNTVSRTSVYISAFYHSANNGTC